MNRPPKVRLRNPTFGRSVQLLHLPCFIFYQPVVGMCRKLEIFSDCVRIFHTFRRLVDKARTKCNLLTQAYGNGILEILTK